MKITFIKTSWFSGSLLMCGTVQTAKNITAKIFRVGPIIVRIEK